MRAAVLCSLASVAWASGVPIAVGPYGTLERFRAIPPETTQVAKTDGLSPSSVTLQRLDRISDNSYAVAREECMEVPFSLCVGTGKAIVPSAQPKSLVGYWSFDDMLGQDDSGKQNGMTPYPQVGPARGGVGQSAYFNGTNYGLIPHIGDFESREMTITFWMFLLQDYTGVFRYVLQKGDSRQFTPTLSLWDKNNKLHLKVTTDTGVTESLDSTAVLQMGRWTHIAIVIQGKLLQMYVNGIMDAQLIAMSNIQFNRMPFYVGRGPEHSGTACFIDELKVYRASLQESAIQAASDGVLGPVGPTFTRLGCHNCTKEAAALACSVFNMHGGYELCAERDMLGGALMVARAQGWLYKSKMRFWTNKKGSGGGAGAGLLSDAEEASKGEGEKRLGLCCRRTGHHK